MRKLYVRSWKDEAISKISSCVGKIEELELEFDARHVTKPGLEILSTAINNRPTPVGILKLIFYQTRYFLKVFCKIVKFQFAYTTNEKGGSDWVGFIKRGTYMYFE